MASVAYPDQADRRITDTEEPEGYWDVLSVRDRDGEPKLGNCVVLVGDHVLEFVRGVAKAPEEVLPLVVADKRMRVPGYRGASSVDGYFDKDATPDGVVKATKHAAPNEDDLAAVLAEDAAVLGTSREALTKDGRPRCQAVKPDGTQCTNSAADGEDACGLGAHKSQLA